jgi:hypothetical protein
MMRFLLGVCFLFLFSGAYARTSVEVQIQVPIYGGYGVVQTAPQYYYPAPVYVQPAPTYVMPPRYPEPVYKTPEYYRQRSSCYPYPIHDMYGRVVYYETRCN